MQKENKMYLEKINSPKDLKKIAMSNLPAVCDEVRNVLLTKLSNHGGHIGSNLGVVELTVALHYVFNSPVDKIVFDVSHQCYVHKMLTGRKDAFLFPERYDDVNGFTNPEESVHDLFTVGHTSTSLSLACGLAKARDLLGQTHSVVAVIGDGSLSGGEAYEGLNNIAEQATPLVIVVNDNEMSIAENHGGYIGNLAKLRATNGKSKNNMFTALGLQYMYVEEGNDVLQVVKALKRAQKVTKPIVVHVHTQKGKGFAPAEQNRELFHAGGPFSLQTGAFLKANCGENYSEITYRYLSEKIVTDKSVVAVSSATPAVLAMDAVRRQNFGARFVDVGICEEHAVAFVSGIARGGAKPVYAVSGTFLQRSFDQLHQDLALDSNPATLLVFLTGVARGGGATHNGLFDIAELSNIPNLVYLAPVCVEEYLAMLDWATEQNKLSVAIRVPTTVVHGDAPKMDYSQLNRSQVVQQGSEVAIFAVGNMFTLGKKVAEQLATKGVAATLVNPVYLSGLDKELLQSISQNHRLVVTVEDGILDGGYGQKVASYFGDSNVKVKNFGMEKQHFGDFDTQRLMQQNGLTVDAVFEYVLDFLQQKA